MFSKLLTIFHSGDMVHITLQRQWWEFKSKHMDKVIFFKVLLLLSCIKYASYCCLLMDQSVLLSDGDVFLLE